MARLFRKAAHGQVFDQALAQSSACGWQNSLFMEGPFRKPVNVLMDMPDAKFGTAELTEVGVKRISVGPTLAQLAY